MKEMLVYLRASLHANITSSLRQVIDDIEDLGDRMDHVETKIKEFATSFNEPAGSNTEKGDNVAWLKAKVANVEGGSRRNKMKVRGIPKIVLADQLPTYIQQMFQSILPNMSNEELLVDRVHHLPRPSHLPDTILRDVILCVYLFHKFTNSGALQKS